MPTHAIEIEGLPEDWEVVAYRVPKTGDYILNDREQIQYVDADYQLIKCLIVQKNPSPAG